MSLESFLTFLIDSSMPSSELILSLKKANFLENGVFFSGPGSECVEARIPRDLSELEFEFEFSVSASVASVK